MEKELYAISDTQADDLITEIKALQEEKQRYEVIASQQIQVITDKLQAKHKYIESSIQFNKDQLRAFFLTVERKSTKTQESYSLLSGKLVMKKATTKITHDDAKLLKWAEENGQNYIISTQTSRLNWTGLKSDLSISNGMIVNKSTSEVLEGIEGLSLEEVKEQFEIK